MFEQKELLNYQQFLTATGIPTATMRRMIKRGDITPAVYNGNGKPSYFSNEQVAIAKEIYAKTSKFGKRTTNEPPAQIDTPATVEASNDQTPADSEHDATNEDSKPVDDQHEETPATVTEPIVDEEFKTLIAPLSDAEFTQLEASVLQHGILDPLKTWNGILVDGHHRFSIAKKYGLTFKTTELQFDSRDDVIVWIGKNQMARRNLNRYARGELALKLESSIAVQAKANLVTHTADGYQPLANLPNAESINTRDKLAKIAGVSSRLLGTIKYLVDNATEEIKTALRNDQLTINAAHEAVKAGATTVDDVENFKAQKKTPPTVTETQHAEQPAREPVEEPPAATNEDSDAEKVVVGNYSLKGIVNEDDGDEFSESDGAQNLDNATGQISPKTLSTPETNDTSAPVTNEPPKDDSEKPAQIDNEPQGTTAEENFMQVFEDMTRYFSPELFAAIHKAIASATVDDLPALKKLHDALNSVAQEIAEIVILIEVKIGEMLNETDKEKSPATAAGRKDMKDDE